MIYGVHFASFRQVDALAKALGYAMFGGSAGNWQVFQTWPKWLKKMYDIAKRGHERVRRAVLDHNSLPKKIQDGVPFQSVAGRWEWTHNVKDRTPKKRGRPRKEQHEGVATGAQLQPIRQEEVRHHDAQDERLGIRGLAGPGLPASQRANFVGRVQEAGQAGARKAKGRAPNNRRAARRAQAAKEDGPERKGNRR